MLNKKNSLMNYAKGLILMIEMRWAQLDDVRDLGYVQSESYQRAYKGIMPDEYLNQYTPIAREKYFFNALIKGTEHIAIMLVDNIVAGCMILKGCNDSDLHKFSGEISAIYFLQTYTGLGLGSQFLNWGIEKLKDFGYSTAILWVLKENTNAIRFYEKQNFVHDGTERTIFRGRELIQIRYQRAI